MIIVIAGKQSACPNEKQKDFRRVSNLVLTAHAGTFIRPRNRAGNACVPHLGATENWTIEQLPTKIGPMRPMLEAPKRNTSDQSFYLQFKFTPKIGHTFTDEREVVVEVPKNLV
jgi:hypothetical protein